MEPVSCTETDVSVQSALRTAQLQSTCEVNKGNILTPLYLYFLPVKGTGINQFKHLRNILHTKDLTLKLKSHTKLLFTTMVYGCAIILPLKNIILPYSQQMHSRKIFSFHAGKSFLST